MILNLSLSITNGADKEEIIRAITNATWNAILDINRHGLPNVDENFDLTETVYKLPLPPAVYAATFYRSE
jgi:hypothetical protein